MKDERKHILIIPGIANPLTPAKLLKIREKAPGYELQYTANDNITPELLARTEVIFGRPHPWTLCKAPLLRWLHLPFSGIEPYGDLRLYANQALTLTNARGVYGGPVSEHVLAMALALLRRIPEYVRRQDKGLWERLEDGPELSGMTVLVVGFGDLGQNIASRFAAMGCRILGIRRNFPERPPQAEAVYPLHRMMEILPDCDLVVNCLPSTAHTVRVFDAAAFAAMPPGSFFINVGRGSAVVEPDLAEALTSGHLGGAAIDVASREPLPPEHPFWQTENLLISPHSAAASPRVAERNFALFDDLLTRYLTGRRLYNRVDFFSGY